MSVMELTDLRKQILGILGDAGKPLRTPEIEVQLKLQDRWDADTFDVRDSVAALVASGEAEFVHPGYFVKLTRKK